MEPIGSVDVTALPGVGQFVRDAVSESLTSSAILPHWVETDVGASADLAAEIVRQETIQAYQEQEQQKQKEQQQQEHEQQEQLRKEEEEGHGLAAVTGAGETIAAKASRTRPDATRGGLGRLGQHSDSSAVGFVSWLVRSAASRKNGSPPHSHARHGTRSTAAAGNDLGVAPPTSDQPILADSEPVGDRDAAARPSEAASSSQADGETRRIWPHQAGKPRLDALLQRGQGTRDSRLRGQGQVARPESDLSLDHEW